MKKTGKLRLLSLILALCMVLAMLPAPVLAASASDVTVSGVSGVTTTVLPSDLPEGYRAYCVYDIRLPQGTASDVIVRVNADDSFDAALPVVVLDTLTGQIHSTMLENGVAAFTTNHSGVYVLAQAGVTAVTNTQSAYVLSQVMNIGELESGVPYVIADYYKDWVLTKSATTVSGKTYRGLLLNGYPSPNTTHLWYLDSEGYLVYGSAASDQYLLLGTESNGDPYCIIGSVDSSNADCRSTPTGSSNLNADDLIIGTKDGVDYLNRWGGGNNTVATRYSSVGGSYWSMYRRDQIQVAASAVASLEALPVSATAKIFPKISVNDSLTEDYTITWTSSNPEIATVSEDGLVMPTAAGHFTVTGTVTAVNGAQLSQPILLNIPMSAYVVKGTQTAVSATGYTFHSSELAMDLVAGTPSGPYILANQTITPATYLSGRGPVTSAYCTGLEILPYIDGSQLWYFDGQYLRYRSPEGPYLAYENKQVTLSTTVANAFDDIYLYDYGDAYIIRKSDLAGYNCLNQLGGSNYYAAGLYVEYSGTRWAFLRTEPSREVTLNVMPNTGTVTLGKSTTLTPTVLLDGVATSEYTISWTSRNQSVATVSGGVVTPVSLGSTVITAVITEVGGQDAYVSLDIPLTVSKTTTSGTSSTVRATLLSSWEHVTEVPPKDRITGPYLILNSGSNYVLTGNQGMTNDACTQGGLEMVPYTIGDRTNLWYYDGNGFLYGDPNATDRYLVYEDGQVGLGPDTGMNFNEITRTANATPSFNIAHAKLTENKYLNQLGGGFYNAADVWKDHGDTTIASRWELLTPGQEQQAVLEVKASKTALLLHETADLTTTLILNGVPVSSGNYGLVATSSASSVLKVSDGKLIPQKDGSATVTVSVSKINGRKAEADLTVSIPVTVSGIKTMTLNTKSGAVMVNAAGSTAVGATLSVTYTNGSTYQVPMTVDHLQNADGSAVSTAAVGTVRNLKVMYGGQTVCSDFTLSIRDAIPANGTVLADKSVTGVNFFSSRVAQVELHISGINGEKGTAVGTSAYVLDTMSNYFTLQTAVSGRITPTMQITSYPLYSLQDFQNGQCTLTQVGNRKGNATVVEKITFSADGTKAYSSLLGNTNIYNNGVISASNFWYNSNATASFVSDNGKTLTIPAGTLRWKVGTLSNTEVSLSYYIAIEKGAAAGTYPVGRYTDLYYTDTTSTSCRKSLTSPSIYYEEGEEEVILPTLKPAYASLSFEDEILYNVYFTVTDQGSVTLADMGMITFDSKRTDGTVANCTGNFPGAVDNGGGVLMVQSGGIPAKKLGDNLYFKLYARMPDGTYVYSDVYSYSARQYAQKQLEGSNTKLKQLVVAMVNYGAAAQQTFKYNTGNLINNILTAEHKALVSDYNATMVPSTSVDSSKTVNFANKTGFSKKYATVSFDSAFALNYYFTPDSTPDGNVTMYYWSQADYQKVSTLTTSNATKRITMTKSASGEYTAVIGGIAAKELGNAVYVAVVCTSGGQSYCSGVIGYSVGVYCKSFASNTTSDMCAIGKATIVYSYYAKSYFNAL